MNDLINGHVDALDIVLIVIGASTQMLLSGAGTEISYR